MIFLKKQPRVWNMVSGSEFPLLQNAHTNYLKGFDFQRMGILRFWKVSRAGHSSKSTSFFTLCRSILNTTKQPQLRQNTTCGDHHRGKVTPVPHSNSPVAQTHSYKQHPDTSLYRGTELYLPAGRSVGVINWLKHTDKATEKLNRDGLVSLQDYQHRGLY